MANSETAAAIPQPATRSGICDAVPGIVTGRMKASSSGVVALAMTELTTLLNSTTSPMTNIATVAMTTERDANVPRQMKTAQASPSSVCERSLSSRVPVKSTNSSIANEPNARKYDMPAFSMTFSPSANSAGITIAARPARRSAM